MRNGILIVLFIAISAALGCSDANLSRVQYTTLSNPGIDFCTTPADTIKSNLKFIYVIDHSGSNQQDFDAQNNPLPGTDPTGTRRYDPLIAFVNSLQNDPYIFNSVVNFSTQATTALPLTNNKTTTINFLNQQKATIATLDNGWTDYLAALDQVNTLINDDIAFEKQQLPIVTTTYVVFWVSDGAPYIAVGNNVVLEPQNQILSKISTILALKDQNPDFVDGILINTGFYYNSATSPDFSIASNLMGQMAQAGNGVFLQFGAGQAIDFTRFSVPTRTAKFDLREIWVTNVNMVWWNGQLMRDSDGDGLPDDIERQLGSDPNNPDTDGNGVRDGVEYKLSGKPCQDAACSKVRANPFSQCIGLKNRAIDVNGNVTFGDIDKDYLNDCEETVLGSNLLDFDSNQDYIPDDLALKYGIGFIKGTDDSQLDPDNDGVTNYYEIKFNTPPFTNNNSMPNLSKVQYIGNKVSENSVQSCYHYDIKGLQMSANDLIRVYLMENRTIVGQKRLMRTAQKRGNIIFSDGDFN